LHDGLAQDLVALGYQVDLLLANEGLATQARADIRKTRFDITSLIEKVRSEILELRSSGARNLEDEIRALVESLAAADLKISLDLESFSVTSLVHHELLAIVGEILRNSIAHSRATRIALTLSRINNQIHLGINDDGVGGVEVRENHWGIIGITERVERLGGTLAIESEQGMGTHFHIVV
jgi:signal transduction histidine kinase